MNKDEKNEQKKSKLVLRRESLKRLNTKDVANVRGGVGGEEVPESGTKKPE